MRVLTLAFALCLPIAAAAGDTVVTSSGIRISGLDPAPEAPAPRRLRLQTAAEKADKPKPQYKATPPPFGSTIRHGFVKSARTSIRHGFKKSARSTINYAGR